MMEGEPRGVGRVFLQKDLKRALANISTRRPQPQSILIHWQGVAYPAIAQRHIVDVPA